MGTCVLMLMSCIWEEGRGVVVTWEAVGELDLEEVVLMVERDGEEDGAAEGI